MGNMIMENQTLEFIMGWIKGLILGPPIWVWFLLVYLMIIGVKSFNTRKVPIFIFYLTPFLGLLSVRSISALEHATIAWVVFGLIYIISVFGFFMWQKRNILERHKRHMVLKGEWVSLASFMVIFWANFVQGVLTAVSPQTYQSLGFVVIFSAMLGLVSGSFLGRPLSNIFSKPILNGNENKLIKAAP